MIESFNAQWLIFHTLPRSCRRDRDLLCEDGFGFELNSDAGCCSGRNGRKNSLRYKSESLKTHFDRPGGELERCFTPVVRNGLDAHSLYLNLLGRTRATPNLHNQSSHSLLSATWRSAEDECQNHCGH